MKFNERLEPNSRAKLHMVPFLLPQQLVAWGGWWNQQRNGVDEDQIYRREGGGGGWGHLSAASSAVNVTNLNGQNLVSREWGSSRAGEHVRQTNYL